MLLQLAECVSSLDSGLSLSINKTDSLYTFKVVSEDIGDMYSFSSTNSYECFDKIVKYIEAMSDADKFVSLIKEIETIPLEA